jgi:hypothetical protein
VTYTITYRNQGQGPLSALVVRDATPAFTVLVSAAAGSLPADLTQVSIQAPAPGAAGSIAWTFQGTLAPGASGTVQFTVRIQ